MSIDAMKKAHKALLSAANCIEYEEIAEDLKQEARDLRQAIAQAEKQEPYAYIYKTNGAFGVHMSLKYAEYNGRYPDKNIPVYTAPPQREWVGLTDEEITELFCDYDAIQFPKFVRTVEVKLREKNAYGLQSVNNPSEWLD